VAKPSGDRGPGADDPGPRFPPARIEVAHWALNELGGNPSLALTEERECDAYGHRAPHPVWLIVDTLERPDFEQLVREDRLREGMCPVCGAPVELGSAILLLYRPTVIKYIARRMLFEVPGERPSADPPAQAVKRRRPGDGTLAWSELLFAARHGSQTCFRRVRWAAGWPTSLDGLLSWS
jgi:hypothetical protein